MIFSLENAGDLKRYFQGSYVKFPEAGDLVHFVDRVEGSIVRGRFLGPNDKGEMEEQEFRFNLYSDTDMKSLGGVQPDVQFILPRKSYFNFQGCAHLLYRVPARQYHRGVTQENTRIVRLNSSGDFDGVNLKFDLLTAYVGKQAFPGFSQAFNGSYAVSPRIAVSASCQLFVDQVRIGSINYPDKNIVVNSELFVPEIQKIIGNSDFTVNAPAPKPRKAKQVSPKGYVPKKMEVNEYNEVL